MVGVRIARWLRAKRAGNIPQFIIHGPDYTTRSSGARCLHLLCHRLNQLGFSAAVTARRRNPALATPRIKPDYLRNVPGLLDRSIVIYPEVEIGNPLGARNVVRYLLNKPGFFGLGDMQTYGADDYFVHFAEEFRPPDLTSTHLRLPLVDTDIFKPLPHEGIRRGFLLYSVRHSPGRRDFPDWVDDVTVISKDHLRSPAELAALYQRNRGLITAERTAAVAEALHCHCPVIMLPHPNFDHEPFMASFGGVGKTVGFDRDGFARAAETAHLFPARHAEEFADINDRLAEFVTDVRRYFQMSG